MRQIRRSGPPPQEAAPTLTNTAGRQTAGSCDYMRLSAGVCGVAAAYKDRARRQARAGMITWDQFRRFSAEADRIKRDRLAEGAAACEAPDTDPRAAIGALMGRPHRASGGGWQARCGCGAWVTPRTARSHMLCPAQPESGESSPRAARRAAITDALRAAPQSSDRAIARQVGCDHKTVAAARQRMAESGEIPHFLRRVDPRTGRHTQPATKRTKPAPTTRTAVTA